jgi:hypothetical protein
MWVSSSASTHRALGQLTQLLVQVGQDLLAVGVTLGDQTGSPPAGDLADAAAQGPLADGGSVEALPQPADRPLLGLGEQPADALAQPGLPRRGRPARGRSASPLVPWVL